MMQMAVILLEAGTYEVTTTINMKDDVHVRGMGVDISVIRHTGQSINPINRRVFTVPGTLNGVSVTNLTALLDQGGEIFDGAFMYSAGVTGPQGVLIDNIKVDTISDNILSIITFQNNGFRELTIKNSEINRSAGPADFNVDMLRSSSFTFNEVVEGKITIENSKFIDTNSGNEQHYGLSIWNGYPEFELELRNTTVSVSGSSLSSIALDIRNSVADPSGNGPIYVVEHSVLEALNSSDSRAIAGDGTVQFKVAHTRIDGSIQNPGTIKLVHNHDGDFNPIANV
jgi:hypothetical protein